jgi:hypothetical protein
MNRIGLSVTLWLIAAFLSFIGSVFCWFLVDREVGLFIGLWVPSILSFGCLVIVARGARGLEV